MSTIISAPYLAEKVTVILPSAELEDSRQPEHDLTVKRSMLGRVITYVRSNPRQALQITLQLSRMKSLELDAFLRIYYVAEWRLTDYNGDQWRVKLTGEPVRRTAIQRSGGTEGTEIVEVQLSLSGVKL